MFGGGAGLPVALARARVAAAHGTVREEHEALTSLCVHRRLTAYTAARKTA
jgi:hypothetical protein